MYSTGFAISMGFPEVSAAVEDGESPAVAVSEDTCVEVSDDEAGVVSADNDFPDSDDL